MSRFFSFVVIFLFVCCLFTPVLGSVSEPELVANSWNTKTPMTQARSSLGAVVVDGKIYAIGGWADDGFVGTTECYDPVSDTWVTLKSMPTPRYKFGIVAYQSKIYCMSGVAGGILVGDDYSDVVCGVNEVYDTATNSWSTMADMPFKSGWLQAHVVDEKIFVLSGVDLYVYDPLVDVWIKKASMPANAPIFANERIMRNFCVTSFVVDGKIMCLHVYESRAEFLMVGEHQRLLVYDIETDVWVDKGKPPENLLGAVVGATLGLYAPQRGYFIQAGITAVYNPQRDTWSTAKPMPTDRVGYAVVVLNDILYVIGGMKGVLVTHSAEYLSVNEQYVPIGYHGGDFSLNTIAFGVLVLMIGVVVASLFFYFKRKKYLNSTL